MNPRVRIENTGASVINFFAAGIDLWRVFIGTLAGVIRGGRPRGEVANQMYIIGNKSLLFVAVTLGFIGMVMMYQMCLQINRITGDLSLVGPEFIKIVTHQFAPSLVALMIATRVGAGIAAEVGSMKVTEQIDALRMSGVRPIDYLIVPRFIACVIMTVVLTIYGAVVTFCAAGLTAYLSFGVNPRLFFVLDRVNFAHLGLGMSKAICYGIAIPIIAGFCGLRAQGSSEGVGWATTAAVIGSSFAVIMIDFVISAIGLLLFAEQLA